MSRRTLVLGVGAAVREPKRNRLAIVHQTGNGSLVPSSLPSPFQADTRIANGAGNLCGTIGD